MIEDQKEQPGPACAVSRAVFSLRPWQVESVRTLASNLAKGNSCLDASDTGTGKTIVALAACKQAGLRPYVICPKSVVCSWKEAADLVGVDLLGAVNIEKLKTDQTGFIKKRLGWWRWDRTRLPANSVLVFDEVHRCAAFDSDNAKVLASAPGPVVMLSATAIESPIKFRAIGHQLRLVPWADWYTWCGQNGCYLGRRGELRFNDDPRVALSLNAALTAAGRLVRVRISDLGDAFPARQIQCIEVPVEDQEAIDRAFVEELEQLKCGLPSVDMLRCRQIAEHEILPALFEIVEDDLASGCKCVVFCNFRDTLARVTEKFGCPGIYGGQPGDERTRAVTGFGRPGGHNVLACMSQAGGCGLDGLQDHRGDGIRVGHVIPGWSAVDFRQLLGRLHRANSKSHCIYKVLTASRTIQERVHRKLKRKLENIDLINDGDLSLI